MRESRQFYFNGWRGNRTVMQFPQQSPGTARTEVGFVSPVGANWTHNGGAGIEMLHQGTSSCNQSSRIQWAQVWCGKRSALCDVTGPVLRAAVSVTSRPLGDGTIIARKNQLADHASLFLSLSLSLSFFLSLSFSLSLSSLSLSSLSLLSSSLSSSLSLLLAA